jgi:hypothetical protein
LATAVIEQRALDKALPHNLDEEIDIALRPAGAQGDVVQALNPGHRDLR